MQDGSIKHYTPDLGMGMIVPADGSGDVVFSRHVVEGGEAWLAEGVAVRYTLFDNGGETPEAAVVCRAT